MNGAQEALTGQTITAKLSVSGTINSIKWSVSGSVFKTWSGTTIPQKVALSDTDYSPTPPSAALTFNDATAETVTVSCTGTYTDLDGDTLPANPTPQAVTFMKPTVTRWDINTGYVQELMNQTIPGQTGTYNLFGLFEEPTTTNKGGEDWENITIALPPDFVGATGGMGCLAQLVTPNRTETYTDPNDPSRTATQPAPGATNGVQGLDNEFPIYQWSLPTLGGGNDSPCQLVTTTGQSQNGFYASASDSFMTWVMFQPSGGVWVPLQDYLWRWSATISWVDTEFVLTSGDPTSDDTPIYQGAPTESYPTWTTIQSNVGGGTTR